MPREMEIDPDYTTVGEAHEWLIDNVTASEGAICPCCERFDKVYNRRISQSSIRDLCRLYRQHQLRRDHDLLEFFHYNDFTGQRPADTWKFKHINLIEEGAEKGYWRITQRGVAFVERRLRIRERMIIYHGELLGTDGDRRWITQMWPRFNYEELMSATPPRYLMED